MTPDAEKPKCPSCHQPVENIFDHWHGVYYCPEPKGGDEPCAAPVGNQPDWTVQSTIPSAASNAPATSDPLSGADQWRMLEVGEVIQEGDEFQLEYGKWYLARNDYGVFGKRWSPEDFAPYRRRISPPVQSETPEADANAIECRQFDRNMADYVSLACGRRLERQRDEARRERDEAQQQFEQYAGWSRWKPGLWLIMHTENSHDATWVAESMDELITIRAALAKAEQERDEALSRLKGGTL